MSRRFLRPRSLADASRLLAGDPSLKPLAGGTLVFPLERRGLWPRQDLLDLSLLGELKNCEPQEPGLYFLGAGLKVAQLAEDDFFISRWPLLARAAARLASPQIRAQATLGGNLASGHPMADLGGPLLALGAELAIYGPAGERTLSLKDFLSAQGALAPKCPEFGCGGEKNEQCPPPKSILPFTGRPFQAYSPPSSLAAGELIMGLRLSPKKSAREGGFFKYVREAARPALDFSIISISLMSHHESGCLKNPRLALTGAGPASFLAKTPDEADLGAPASRRNFLDEVGRDLAERKFVRPCQPFRLKLLTNALEIMLSPEDQR